jgi:hypothetical protein
VPAPLSRTRAQPAWIDGTDSPPAVRARTYLHSSPARTREKRRLIG